METIFKKGDKVFDYTYGWGIVDDIDDFTVRVKFDSISNNTVLFWGILLKTLSFTEYTLEGFSQEQPEPLPNPGDIVWVRDMEYDNWMITYFRRFNSFDDAKLRYGCNPRNSADSTSIYYYKYLTTKNPYENN
jgi:hypothetical protein